MLSAFNFRCHVLMIFVAGSDADRATNSRNPLRLDLELTFASCFAIESNFSISTNCAYAVFEFLRICFRNCLQWGKILFRITTINAPKIKTISLYCKTARAWIRSLHVLFKLLSYIIINYYPTLSTTLRCIVALADTTQAEYLEAKSYFFFFWNLKCRTWRDALHFELLPLSLHWKIKNLLEYFWTDFDCHLCNLRFGFLIYRYKFLFGNRSKTFSDFVSLWPLGLK